MRAFCSSSGGREYRPQAPAERLNQATRTGSAERNQAELGACLSMLLQEAPAFRLLRFHRLTDIALAHPAQEVEGIDAGVVAVAPCESQRVSADRFDILDHDEQRHLVSIDAELTGPLIGAGCAGAVLPEVSNRIHPLVPVGPFDPEQDRKSTRLNSSHSQISYAVFCLKKT